MKKTGSEIASDEAVQSKAAPAEPVERARLQTDVAKQRVRIAKEELKRARKRLKEAKREARRARKLAAVAHKAWKQERRASKDSSSPDKQAAAGKSKKPRRAAPATQVQPTAKPAAKARKAAASPKARPATAKSSKLKSSKAKVTTAKVTKPKPTAPAQVSAKRNTGPRVERMPVKSRNASNGTAPKPRATRAENETQATESFATVPAANSEELGTVDSATTNGAAVEHGT